MKADLNISFYKGEKFKETPIGKIPEDWKIAGLENNEYFEILSSGIQPFEGKKLYLSTKCIEGSKIVGIETEITFSNRPSRANMQPVLNSVWFAKMKNTIKVYSFTNENFEEINKYILSTGFCGIKVKAEVFPEYLKQFFLSSLFNKLKDTLVTGSTQQDIKQNAIKNIKIPLSSLPEQKAIAHVLSTVDEAIQKTNEIIERTERLKKGLMQELLTKGIVLGFMFDFQVFDKILDGKIKLPQGLNYYVTNAQLDEICYMPDSKKERREEFLRLFNKVPKEFIPAKDIVHNVSRFDTAKFLGKTYEELYYKMLARLKELDERDGKKTSPENQATNILMVLTCLKNCLTLVTENKNLKMVAQEFQVPAITFEQFQKGEYREFKDTEIGRIPREWQVVRLKEVILEAKPGFACGKRDENGVIQLRMDSIDAEGWINPKAYVKVPSPRNVKEYFLTAGDILFNNTNSIDLIGKTAIFRGEFSECVYSNHLTRIRVNRAKVIPEWILYIFIRKWRSGVFKALCHPHVHQAGISKADLLNLKIPLPPLSEQNKITEIILSVDKKLRIEIRRKEKLERIKKALMDLLLSGKIRVKVG